MSKGTDSRFDENTYQAGELDELLDGQLLGAEGEQGRGGGFRGGGGGVGRGGEGGFEFGERGGERVTEHLTALVEGSLDHANEKNLVAIEVRAGVTGEANNGALNLGRRRKHTLGNSEKVLDVVPSLKKNAEDTVSTTTGRLGDTKSNLALDHTDNLGNQVAVGEHFEEYLARNVVGKVTDDTNTLRPEGAQVELQEVALDEMLGAGEGGEPVAHISDTLAVDLDTPKPNVGALQQKLSQNTHTTADLKNVDRGAPLRENGPCDFAGDVEVGQKVLAERFLSTNLHYRLREGFLPAACWRAAAAWAF